MTTTEKTTTEAADILAKQREILKAVYADSIPLSKEEIKKIIDWNEKERKPYLLKLYDYYRDKHPILERNKTTGLKNNKVVVNHAKYITKLRVGYILGKPVEYHIEGKDVKERDKQALDVILNKYKEQTIRDLDKSIGRDCSIYGFAYEYLYVNEDAEIKSFKINPLNSILVRNKSVEHKKLFFLQYSSAEIDKKTGEMKYEGVRLLTDEFIYEFDENLRQVSKTPHYIGEVPIIEYTNDEDREGDYESVLTMIDAYNTLQSDRVNDKEQLVEAILVLYGMEINDEVMNDIKIHRAFGAPPQSEGAKAEYLTKTLVEDQIQILKKDIENDIFKIAMTPNITDEMFAGNSSGVALKFKLLPFEISIQDKETGMERGLRERLQLYSRFYKTKKVISTEIQPYRVNIVFNKSLPQNDLETSQIINNLDDFVDRETLISQLSFVKDASKVIEKKTEEDKQRLNLETPEYGIEANK